MYKEQLEWNKWGNRVSKTNIMIIILSIILSFTFLGCSDQTTEEEQLDKHMDKVVYSSDLPSISILVVDNGKPVYKKSFGCANMETLEKATPSTNYRLASVSKMFTAMSIMILKDRGQLDYDMRVKDILKDFPEYGKDITIRHLLNHTSGLRSFYDLTDLLDEEFSVENQLLDSDVYEIVKRTDSTYFTPGSIFKYSDTGYVILGLVVEEVSGMKLPDFMRENIFIPLNMDNTVVFDKTLNMSINNRAYGTESDGTKFITKDQSYSSATRGDGSIYSSLEDLYKWDQALYSDILVSKETMQEAYTPPNHLNSLFENYTCGWIFRKNGEDQLEQVHAGGTQGFSTIYFRIPEKKQSIIILSNRNESNTVYELDDPIRKIYDFAKESY
ncbi:serine hydrolase domain-containing protein [Wukongibacter baidiensis]|uniref:serine hydrolase domain-containing protein n=1 Tax=Wukongibacter baidiensis TaxID=1723361 RepID=UPI003D7F9C14